MTRDPLHTGSADDGPGREASARAVAASSTKGPATRSGNDLDDSWGDLEAEAEAEVEGLQPGASVARYMILERVGAGAMGVVYAAYDPGLDRKVALKLLRPDRRAGDPASAESKRARLFREAKALARLSHPNVVAIHDVGLYGDQVFLAMEFVEGLTLKRWLAEAPRSWQQVLDVMRRAGAGLSAAHEAGLVHRDFKPENVLISPDGRVRVLDFGLARAEDKGSTVDLERSDARVAAALEASRSRQLESASGETLALTSTGALVGTPAYMSPEQHMGEPADARSDQFSLCVSTYEALYGARPFAGENLSGLAFNVISGRIAPPPPGTAVPPWLRKAVLRGLRVDPKERFPSVAALLSAMTPVTNRVRRRWLWAAAALALVVGVALGRGASTDAPCRDASDRLASIWNPTVAAEIAASFQGTGLPYAANTWKTAEALLDDYAKRWIDGYTSACEATHVRGDQSPDLLDRRMLCLDRRRTELRALTEAFASPDETIVEHAREGVAALAPVEPCGDQEALLAVVPLPTDPETRARVQELREQLAEVRVLDLRGKWRVALERGVRAASDADALAYPPLAAEIRVAVAILQHQLGRSLDAEATLRVAIRQAAEGRSDALAARAWIELVFVTGILRNQYDLAILTGQAAAAMIARAGGDDVLSAHLDLHRAFVLDRMNRPDEADPLLRGALATLERELGEDHPLVHRGLTGLSLIELHQGEFAAAEAALERSREIIERVSGAEHPGVAAVLTNLANVATEKGDLARAHELAQQAVKIRERVTPNHPSLASALTELARVEEELGRFEDAETRYERALAILQASESPNALKISVTLNNLGTLELGLDRPDHALTHFRDAHAALVSIHGVEHPQTLTVDLNVAEALLRSGDPAGALEREEGVRRLYEAAYDDGAPERAEPLTLLGEIELALGEPDRAITPLEEALSLIARDDPDTLDTDLQSRARFALARALVALGRDLPRARELAVAAGEGVDSRRPGAERRRAQQQAFLDALAAQPEGRGRR
ncbi:MAG: tetratricopeptide repeat protein [Nannocystaceae bacterium]|nr:tetratricopeptide repeat protein [Myxococcales bacterium]